MQKGQVKEQSHCCPALLGRWAGALLAAHWHMDFKPRLWNWTNSSIKLQSATLILSIITIKVKLGVQSIELSYPGYFMLSSFFRKLQFLTTSFCSEGNCMQFSWRHFFFLYFFNSQKAKNTSIGYHNTYWRYTSFHYIKQQIHIRMNLPGMCFMLSCDKSVSFLVAC